MNRFRNNQRGFTMIELMVVVVIVGILAAIAIPIYGKYVANARTTEATARLSEMMTAAKAWGQQNGTWPTQAQFTAGEGILDARPTDNFTYKVADGSGGGNPNSTAFAVEATGIGNMQGTSVKLTVTNITSTGDIVVNLNQPAEGEGTSSQLQSAD